MSDNINSLVWFKFIQFGGGGGGAPRGKPSPIAFKSTEGGCGGGGIDGTSRVVFPFDCICGQTGNGGGGRTFVEVVVEVPADHRAAVTRFVGGGGGGTGRNTKTFAT